jgi:serine/threonine protein kinase
LDESQAEAIADHIESCEPCRETVGGVERETSTLLRQLQVALPNDPLLDEPQCLKAVQEAQRVSVDELIPWEDNVAVSVSTEPPLERIRDYQVLRKLADGGMGTVYEAVHTRLKRTVALKLLGPARTDRPEAVARFRREMEAVGRLDHPNIVRATDAGEFQGRHFLVMDFVDGCDLARLVRLLGPLRVADACQLVREAALGLQHVHENGLVHRDVKPSNLMLARNGVVKVTDLGLALLEERRFGSLGKLTESGQIMGTLDYMAPEQFSNAQVDIRADVYGLGATLFKMLTGDSPLEGPDRDTPLKKLAALANFQRPDIRECRADLPVALAGLVDRMLAADPDDRPSTPAEVAEALLPLTNGCDLVSLCASALDLPLDESSAEGTSKRSRPTHAGLTGERVLRSEESATADSGDARFATSTTRQPKVSQQLRPPHRWARKTVVWTMVATTIAATTLVIGVMSLLELRDDQPVPDGNSDREVAGAVLEIGGTIEIAHKDDSLEIADAQDLPQQPFRIQWIMLTANERVDDDLLTRIATLRSLVGLTLQNTNITDAGVRELGRISTLDSVYFHGAPLTDVGVLPLTELPNLRELVLSDTKITDVTLQRLVPRRQLLRLNLKGTRITDSGMEYVGRMASLQRLYLPETAVTDAGLRHLTSLSNLEELGLSKTAVTDSGLAHLAHLNKLRLLYLAGTAVTPAGVQRLQDALKGCQIVLDE